MKAILVSVFFIAAFHNISFSQDTINWRADYKLKWEDFQGPADSSSPHAAVTHYNVSYFYFYRGSSLKTTVSCFFDKKKSWKKTNLDDQLLRHEQGHFDIAQLTAKKLAKAFAAYKFKAATVDADLKKIHAAILNEGNMMQDKYDEETASSRNNERQEAWLKDIKEQLQ